MFILETNLDNATYPLTFREMEVTLLLAKGKKNKEIAETLHVSTEAIRSRLKKIYEKLEVCNRTQAAIKIMELNVIAFKINAHTGLYGKQ